MADRVAELSRVILENRHLLDKKTRELEAVTRAYGGHKENAMSAEYQITLLQTEIADLQREIDVLEKERKKGAKRQLTWGV